MYKKADHSVRIQSETVTPANKRIMAYSLSTVILLSGIIIWTSFII